MMFVEIGLGITIRGRAGHNQKRHGFAVTPHEGEHLVGVNLKKALVGNGANGEHSFGPFKTEPASLPAGDEQNGNFSASQRFFTKTQSGNSDRWRFHLRWKNPFGIGPGSGFISSLVQPIDFFEIDVGKLFHQLLTLSTGKLFPTEQYMLLPMCSEPMEQIGGKIAH